MTDQPNTKQKPAFYIFVQDGDGNLNRIGAAFKHRRGHGMNILLDNKRYVAFPPRELSETGESA